MVVRRLGQNQMPFMIWCGILKAQGVPIDGIGLQSHFSVEEPPNFKDIITNLKRLAALGLEIHVTELDVACHCPSPKKNCSSKQTSIVVI